MMTEYNSQRPITPPRNEIGDMDFTDAFGKNNGAELDTPERPELIMKQKMIKRTKGSKKPLSAPNFSDWTKKVDAKASKKGGKTKKRKSRSRKQKKSHKKKTKKRKTKRRNKKSKK